MFFLNFNRIYVYTMIGMSAVNDLEGCTYMSQSLPFGGCKKSGYDRFAGPEGNNIYVYMYIVKFICILI